MSPTSSRRSSVLSVLPLAAVALTLSACGAGAAGATVTVTVMPSVVATSAPASPSGSVSETASAPVPSAPASSPPAALTYPSPTDGTLVSDYLPGLAAQVRVPTTAGPAPLIVMVPGGAWATADPNMLAPLAARLTVDGSTTSVLTYSTTEVGSTFPTAVDQVACGVRWSAQQAAAMGHPPTRVILLGHSAGGQLASLVTFSGDEFGRDCPAPPVAINGLIGMAGVYNTDWFVSGMTLWMGVSPADAPDAWARANPMTWLQKGTPLPAGLRVLLIHGDADDNVPLAQTTALADALRARQLSPSATIFPGLGHLAIIEAGIAEPPIKAWLDAWSAA